MQQNSTRNDAEEPVRRKKKKKGFSFLSAITYLFIILLVSTLLTGIVIVLSNDVFAFVKEDRVISVTIPEKASVGDVSKVLDKNGVINYGLLFQLFVSLTVKDAEFKAGDYPLNSQMDYRAILNVLRKNPNARNTVTVIIPEGWTISQIKTELLEKKVCTATDLSDVLRNYPFKHEFLPKDLQVAENRLEGYLFPDTYEFYENDKAVNVINKMLNNFDNKLDDGIRELAESRGQSIKDTVIIASLIEREAKLEDEQSVISGVIHNRLNSKKYPNLEIDAALQYALGTHKEKLSTEDTKIDSPYNTYINKGLPPGPIANPGFGALYAAVNPDKHDYYFYVAKSDGSHIFSKTYDEHKAAIKKVENEQ